MKMKPGCIYLVYIRQDNTCEVVTALETILTGPFARDREDILRNGAKNMFNALLDEIEDHDSGRKPKEVWSGTVDDQ